MNFPLYLGTMDAFVTAYTQSDILGKLIILGLISLSIICWIVLIQKVWMTRQIEKVSLSFYKAYLINKERLLHLDLDELPKPKNRSVPHPYAEIFRDLKTKTIEVLNKNLHFSTQRNGEQKTEVYL